MEEGKEEGKEEGAGAQEGQERTAEVETSAFCEGRVRKTPSPQCGQGLKELIRVKLGFPSSVLSFQTQERKREVLSLREQS